jgi:D-apionolactonase
MHPHRLRVSPSMTLLPLRAGPVSFVFDQATASIRDLRVGGIEVVRGVYGAVRDRNWRTVPPVLRDLQVDAPDVACRVTFEADCVDGDVDFCWHGTIVGTSTGTVTFTFDGTARTSFLRNRVGLCVLHPIRECAGTPCRVEHVDGRVTSGAFPDAIAPHQPFRDMRAISHLAAPGLHVRVECRGEKFEMENQRN